MAKDKRNKLAIAILTRNEEKDIGPCIDSVKNLDSDIFVFDSFSSDKTVEIANNRECNVVQFLWDGRYPKKKQWVLNYLENEFEWVLLLDADERVSTKLAEEIEIAVGDSRNPEIVACDAELEYWFNGSLLRHGVKPKKRILVKPELVEFPVLNDLDVKEMWEVEGHYQPFLLNGTSIKFKSKLVHHDSDSLFKFFERHNRYSSWEAHVRRNRLLIRGNFPVPLTRRLFERIPFKGLSFFIVSYLFKGGFMDGRQGFNYAISKAFYYWQISVKANQNEYK